MIKFECDICGYESDDKRSFSKHMNKCKKIKNKIQINKKDKRYKTEEEMQENGSLLKAAIETESTEETEKKLFDAIVEKNKERKMKNKMAKLDKEDIVYFELIDDNAESNIQKHFAFIVKEARVIYDNYSTRANHKTDKYIDLFYQYILGQEFGGDRDKVKKLVETMCEKIDNSDFFKIVEAKRIIFKEGRQIKIKA